MTNNRIDVHHHFVPDFWREGQSHYSLKLVSNSGLTTSKAMDSNGGDPCGWPTPAWSLEQDEKSNRRFNITTTILSITAPGVCVIPDRQERAKLARRVNEYAAQLREAEPKKYGFFAVLPDLLDKEDTIEEIRYSLDVLKADGVILYTRYRTDNHYLGHAAFKDIWAELDKRSAVVFVHPTHPVSTTLISGIPQSVMQYPLETTLSAFDMIVNKTVRTYKNCKIILSHGGGALPYMIQRPASALPRNKQEHEAFIDDARSFYFDIALCGGDAPLTILEKFAKPGHLLFGSDIPYADDKIVAYHVDRFNAFEFKDTKLAREVNWENALKLFPRFSGNTQAP
jgi:predicted TIM-barrel fold metal-dependent hydrolase